jgi:hypothetical protein
VRDKFAYLRKSREIAKLVAPFYPAPLVRRSREGFPLLALMRRRRRKEDSQVLSTPRRIRSGKQMEHGEAEVADGRSIWWFVWADARGRQEEGKWPLALAAGVLA